MAKVLDAEIKLPSEVKAGDLVNYDLIGLGSGIYSSKFHASVLKLVNELPDMGGKNAFAFFTCTIVVRKFVDNIVNELKKKNFNVVGYFGCQGSSTWHPFKLTINILKNHPNERDLSDATKFAESLKG